MFFVVVTLVTREEEQVGVLRFDVPDDIFPHAAVRIGIPGEGGNDELFFINRILAD